MASSAVPRTMRAILIHAYGPASGLQLHTLTLPQPTQSQVLLKLDYAGVNYIDTYHRSGLYKLPLPFILGREGAGTVVSTGSAVKHLTVKDRCVFFSSGSYAEYVAVDENACYKLPGNISTRVAAASFLQGLTAHYLINSTFQVKAESTVLIHAAAGGTGSLLVQACKIRGARVIATVGSAEKVEIAKQLGADHVINYREADFEAEVMKLTENVGVNVVYDGVGKSTWEKSLNCVKCRGMLVLFGNASGAVPPIDPFLLSKGSKSICRPSLLDYISDAQEFKGRCEELFEWIGNGKLNVRIAAEFKLEETSKAHEALESRTVAGKILLNCQP